MEDFECPQLKQDASFFTTAEDSKRPHVPRPTGWAVRTRVCVPPFPLDDALRVQAGEHFGRHLFPRRIHPHKFESADDEMQYLWQHS